MTLLALMLALVGGRAPDGLVRYHDAIETATNDATERRVLAVVGRHENYYHLASRTPPFGLTHRLSLGLPRLDVDASAVVALRVLRRLRALCGSWSAALGRFHHGTVGERGGCWSDRLSTREAREAGVR